MAMADRYDLLERLSAAAGDSPDSGDPGISLDRTRLTVRWFGELPAGIRALLADHPGFDVVVEQTRFRPGDLRAEAVRLCTEHADVVQAASARPAGDGIEVLVSPAAAVGGAEAVLVEHGLAGRFPLFVAVGSAVRG